MAEGGFDEMEMGEREVDYEAKYDNLDNDTLNGEYDSLEDRLARDPFDLDAERAMEHINTLWGSDDIKGTLRQRQRVTHEGDRGETDFGGRPKGEKTVTLVDMRHDRAVSMVERFMKEKLDVDINWNVDEGVDLNNRLSLSKEGNVLYSRMGDKGKLVRPQIVLEMKGGVLDYNKSKSEPIVKAVKAFKESIGITADQSEEMRTAIENMPMIADEGQKGEVDEVSQLPPGVFDRLSDIEKDEVRGVFIDIDRAS